MNIVCDTLYCMVTECSYTCDETGIICKLIESLWSMAKTNVTLCTNHTQRHKNNNKGKGNKYMWS